MIFFKELFKAKILAQSVSEFSILDCTCKTNFSNWNRNALRLAVFLAKVSAVSQTIILRETLQEEKNIVLLWKEKPQNAIKGS